MKKINITAIFIIGILGFCSAQKYVPVDNASVLEKHQLIIEQAYPADFQQKVVEAIYDVDENHTLIAYRQVGNVYTEDLVHNHNGESNIIANFTAIPMENIPAIVQDAYAKLSSEKVNRYFVVSGTYEGGEYYCLDTDSERYYFSRLGVRQDPPR